MIPHNSDFWAYYLGFEGAKILHVIQVLILGFGGCWRFLTRVWHLDLDLDMALVFGALMV